MKGREIRPGFSPEKPVVSIVLRAEQLPAPLFCATPARRGRRAGGLRAVDRKRLAVVFSLVQEIPTRGKERAMKYGARNQIRAKVTSVKKGDVMSLVKFQITPPAQAASVLTTESLSDLKLKKGDEVILVIKAIHVLPVKDA